jgi:hypothetical protein
MDKDQILQIVQLGMGASVAAMTLFQKAFEAANNGDLAVAETYLDQSGTHFDRSSADTLAAIEAAKNQPPPAPDQPA